MAIAPRLNVDVLITVCELLQDVSDVLSFALICSSVHPIAIARILRMRPVHLKSGTSIERFHSFLVANTPAHAHHVRAIDIDLRWPQRGANDCSLLLDILASCKRLESLTLAFERASFAIIADPRFLAAINAIPSLRSLSLRSLSVHALSIMPHITTPLRTLHIHSSNTNPSSGFPAVLKRTLPRIIARTVETLTLDKLVLDLHGDVQAPANLLMPPVVNMTPYPAVRSLSVCSLAGKPLLGHLQHLFPALDGTLGLGSLYIRAREETYADIRAANQRSQEGDGSGPSPPVWKKLDRIVCDAPMFYVLGIRCPIRLAMIEFGVARKHCRYVADALCENPVPRLKLSVDHDLGSGAFRGLFTPNLAETLTHLTLCLFHANNYGSTSDGGESELKWDGVLAAIVSAIRPLKKLTHLRVVVGVSVYVYKDATWPFAPWDEYAHTFRPSKFDWEGAAAALARTLPSVQYVFLTTGGFLSNWDEPKDVEGRGGGVGRWKPYERWYVCRGWRVAKPAASDGASKGECSLVELHNDVAETVMRNEELVLSEHDEGALHLNYGWGRTPPPLSVEDVRKKARSGTYM